MSNIGLEADLAALKIKVADLKKAVGAPGNPTAIKALTAVSAANATDLATAQTLTNANKTAINAIIAALKG